MARMRAIDRRQLHWALLGLWLALPGRHPALAAPTPAPGIALHECRLQHPLRLTSVAARCGELAVPEDPGQPQGRRITLHVAVVPAINTRATGAPLFILAGGPGQAASDLYTALAPAFARSRRDHDIVLLDQRGTGASAPLDCDYPQGWEDGGDSLPQLRELTRACLAKWGPRVRFYTSRVAVGDLEAVRQALGYPRIALYGSSYGTRVAQLYMRRHPAQTAAVVLDGVTDPETPIGVETPLDAERALQRILARCGAAADCAAAFPALAAELTGLRAQFGAASQRLTLADPSSGLPLPLDFNRGVFDAALRFLSYNAAQASLLPVLIHQGAAGNLAPLAAQSVLMSRTVSGQLAAGMQNSVVCSEDVPYFNLDPAARTRLQQTYLGTLQVDALTAICALWPRGAVDADLHQPLHSDIPTLLLSGEADPVTPPEDAHRAARFLTHHRELVLAGEGHGQIATGCVPRIVAAFLDSANAQTVDATCLEEHRAPPFFVALTGPAP